MCASGLERVEGLGRKFSISVGGARSQEAVVAVKAGPGAIKIIAANTRSLTSQDAPVSIFGEFDMVKRDMARGQGEE